MITVKVAFTAKRTPGLVYSSADKARQAVERLIARHGGAEEVERQGNWLAATCADGAVVTASRR